MKETDPEKLKEAIQRLEAQIKSTTDPAARKGLKISLKEHQQQLAALLKNQQ